MSDRRIIYVLEPFDVPFGGVAAIYRHVEILHAHGLPAFVTLPRRPARDFYGSTAPLLIHEGPLQNLARPGDIFVIPEGFPAVMKALAQTPARRLMFCQNYYLLPFSREPGAGIAEYEVNGVIASSQAIRDFFVDVYRISDTPILPCAIDPARFQSAPRKKHQIAFMPRKLRREASFLIATFARRHPHHTDVTWVMIDNVSQAESARILGESAVFLSLSHRESLGLPPLEAMACGCLVAGFHGDGGREYATDRNGWWADNGDWKTAIDGLAAALDLVATGGHDLEARRRAMDATVKRYSPARLEAELLAFWHGELSGASRADIAPAEFSDLTQEVVSIKFGP
jgi:glycosyltransferase involved in cell wall biosynthesis